MATENKYDRQLRLWGSHGQRALMEANVVLLGSDGVGSETLKNLVLPGIGKVYVIDDKMVSEQDMGNNFFVTQSDLHTSRAVAVCKNLLEMNDDVQGEAIVSSTDFVINSPDQLLKLKPSIIIASNQTKANLLLLSDICHDKSIPLLIVRSYGFLGYFRLQLRDHDIIEGKPDPANGIIHDTRIYNSFDELVTYATSLDLDTLDSYEHKHVPYIVILIQVLEIWKKSHKGNLPTRDNREELTNIIKSLSDNYVPPTPFIDNESKEDWEKHRGYVWEDNFHEAMDNISKLWSCKAARSDLMELVMSENTNPNVNKTHFSILLQSLQEFMANNDGNLPHSGHIPDMISTTKYFIDLQKIFELKSLNDKNEIKKVANIKCSQCGLDPIDDIILDLFIKNVFDLNRHTTRTYHEEINTCNVEEIQCALWDPAEQKEHTPIVWYFALLATDIFYENNNRYPGQINSTIIEHLQADVDNLWEIITNIISSKGLKEELIDNEFISINHAKEIVRYGALEMHNISAFIGGIASQEAVKVITHQYIPLDTTYIYNGISCIGGKYNL